MRVMDHSIAHPGDILGVSEVARITGRSAESVKYEMDYGTLPCSGARSRTVTRTNLIGWLRVRADFVHPQAERVIEHGEARWSLPGVRRVDPAALAGKRKGNVSRACPMVKAAVEEVYGAFTRGVDGIAYKWDLAVPDHVADLGTEGHRGDRALWVRDWARAGADPWVAVLLDEAEVTPQFAELPIGTPDGMTYAQAVARNIMDAEAVAVAMHNGRAVA